MTGRMILGVLCFAGVAALAAGCGQASSAAGGPGFASGAGAPGGSDAASSNVKEQYTILLFSDSSVSHVQATSYYKASAEKYTQWPGMFVVHEENASMLCWNHYDSLSAARSDLKKAKNFVSPAGQKPFPMAMTIPLPGVDFGPPEWSLLNAQGVYSVLVAVYYDMPERGYIGRKKFAVDCVRRLRQQGYEAYFYHGPARSHVCIGTFPAQAVTKVPVVYPDRGETYRNEIRDPRILTLLEQFSDLSVNETASKLTVGVSVDPRTGATRRESQAQKSTVITIPDRDKGAPL